MFQFSKAGKIGIIIGILGGLAGVGAALIASIAAGDIAGAVIVLIMAVIFIVVFGGVFYGIFKPMAEQAKILKEGRPATAKILELRDTGVTVNENPQIKLKLEVTPEVGSLYEVETNTIISRLQTAAFQPGQTLQVMVDKNDKNKVAIAGFGGAAIPAMNPEEAKKLLEEADLKNRETLLNGTTAKAIVMEYKELGINVNGMNPAVEFELQVIPDDIKPFKAKTIAVVSQSSVDKYQPGEEIYVKYDPNDNTKVTIYHS